MTEIEELKLVVKTHTLLLKQLLQHARDGELFQLSPEEGEHFLADMLGNLPPSVRQTHFHELDSVFPASE